MLEFVMNKQMQTFSFNPLINLVEEETWLSAVTCFEAMNSVFNITDENKSFPFSIPSYWRIPKNLKAILIDKLKKYVKHKSENDIELHVQEARKRSIQIKLKIRKINYQILILLKMKQLKN